MVLTTAVNNTKEAPVVEFWEVTRGKPRIFRSGTYLFTVKVGVELPVDPVEVITNLVNVFDISELKEPDETIIDADYIEVTPEAQIKVAPIGNYCKPRIKSKRKKHNSKTEESGELLIKWNKIQIYSNRVLDMHSAFEGMFCSDVVRAYFKREYLSITGGTREARLRAYLSYMVHMGWLEMVTPSRGRTPAVYKFVCTPADIKENRHMSSESDVFENDKELEINNKEYIGISC